MNERIKELVERAGLTTLLGNNWLYGEQLEEFEALTRQDEAKACAEHYLGIMRDAVEQARADERAACAVIADRYDNGRADNAADLIANEIRQRGEK